MYKLYTHGRIRKLNIDVNINAFFSRGLLLVSLLAFPNIVISKLSPRDLTCVLFRVGQDCYAILMFLFTFMFHD
jgi:hypothetical protein